MTSNQESSDSGIGKSFVSATGIMVAAIFLLLAVVAVLYVLVAAWPSVGGNAASNNLNAQSAIHVFHISFRADFDQRLFILVGLAGALGGLLHSTRSLYWYAGNRALRQSWLMMYLCLPFVGAAMATVFYVVLRGGLIPAEGGSSNVNVFGFTAVAALVGLFSPQAAQKLKEIFNTLLTPAETGKDSVPTRATPEVIHIEPGSGRVGELVRLWGRRLGATTEIMFGEVAAPATIISSEELECVVPDGATSGPVYVKVGDQIIAGPRFEVEA